MGIKQTRASIPASANALTRDILNYLAARGALAWRNNTGALRVDGKHGARFIRFGAVGSGDIFAVLPPHGTFVSIEVKAGRDQLRDSQIAWEEQVKARGGINIVARDLDTVIERLEREW